MYFVTLMSRVNIKLVISKICTMRRCGIIPKEKFNKRTKEACNTFTDVDLLCHHFFIYWHAN